MKRLGALSACLVSAVAGAIAGGLVVGWMMSELSSALLVGESDRDVHAYVAISDELAAGRPDAARRILDARMDEALVRVGAARRDGAPLMARTEPALARIRAQREASGYVPAEAAVAEAVASALAGSTPAGGDAEAR